jgi:hypothetical protein
VYSLTVGVPIIAELMSEARSKTVGQES